MIMRDLRILASMQPCDISARRECG